ncbi:MAG: hypothetical protein ORN85_04820 [Sediminibacterium sp.]|nr:hypothetical protein [Sediminibacterium sp.]
MKYNIIVLWFVFIACSSNYSPKPRGYAQVNFPAKQYQIFNQPNYPYSFEYPLYGIIQKDSSIFGKNLDNKFWLNIHIPSLNGTIYLSYKNLQNKKLNQVVNECFYLANRHTVKATGIDELPFQYNKQLSGMFFNIQGDVATANQFFVTDSNKNFLRGTLYFNTAPNEDSLYIVNKFLVQDMYHLVKTLKWKN